MRAYESKGSHVEYLHGSIMKAPGGHLTFNGKLVIQRGHWIAKRIVNFEPIKCTIQPADFLRYFRITWFLYIHMSFCFVSLMQHGYKYTMPCDWLESNLVSMPWGSKADAICSVVGFSPVASFTNRDYLNLHWAGTCIYYYISTNVWDVLTQQRNRINTIEVGMDK